MPMQLDPVVVRAPSKHSPDDALPLAAPVPVPASAAVKETQTQHAVKQSRRASALSLLRNIHVPHFHSGGSQ